MGLHPILFAVFPILFLYSHNREEALSPDQVLLPLIISLLGTLILWGGSTWPGEIRGNPPWLFPC